MAGPEMSQESIDYARLQEGYGGKHVATLGGEVVASGDTAAEMLREVKEKGLHGEGVTFRFVEAKDTIWCPTPFVVRERPPAG